MITAIEFQKAQKAIESAKDATLIEMKNATFVFTGVDNKHIYFNVIGKLAEISDIEIKNLRQKTRFVPLMQTKKTIYKGAFRMAL